MKTSNTPVSLFRAKREIFAVRGEGLTLPPMCRAPLRFPRLSFMPPVPYPPLRGTFPSRGRLRYEGKLPSQTFGHRLIYIRGEAATITLNLEP